MKINEHLRALWALGSGVGDEWGHVMNLWFGTADVLYHVGAVVPLDWEYRHSPVCEGASFDDWPTAEIQTYYDMGDVNADDLVYFGKILARYAMILRAMGKDY